MAICYIVEYDFFTTITTTKNCVYRKIWRVVKVLGEDTRDHFLLLIYSPLSRLG